MASASICCSSPCLLAASVLWRGKKPNTINPDKKPPSITLGSCTGVRPTISPCRWRLGRATCFLPPSVPGVAWQQHICWHQTFCWCGRPCLWGAGRWTWERLAFSDNTPLISSGQSIGRHLQRPAKALRLPV